jgi:hypothetical protein
MHAHSVSDQRSSPMPARLVGVVLVLLSALGLVAVSAPPAVGASTAYTVSVRFPIELTVFVPCAADDAGEEVDLSGTLHDLFHLTLDGAGGFHFAASDNPQGVVGTGLTTGDVYHAVGVTRSTSSGRVGTVDTYVNNFYIVGTGPGNNFRVHETFHVTVNANGTLTAYVDKFFVTCV